MKKFLKEIARKIVRGAIYAYCKIVHRVKIEGQENIPLDEPLIYCGNHRTYLDPPLIVVTAKRHVRFMAKIELKKNPFFAFLGVVFDGIYVNRDSKDITAIKTALKALKNGECVALFPEGTRNGLEKGQKAKDGVAFFALRSGAKVMPCGISGGTGKFDKVTIRYGKPLDFTNYDKNDKDALDKITDEVMEKIIELTK